MAAQKLLGMTALAVNTPIKMVHLRQKGNVVVAPALGAGETVNIQYTVDNGATWISAALPGGALELNQSTNMIFVEGPLTIGVIKSATVAPVGVYLFGR